MMVEDGVGRWLRMVVEDYGTQNSDALANK